MISEKKRRAENVRWQKRRARLSLRECVEVTSRRATREEASRAKGRPVGIKWLLRYSHAVDRCMKSVRYV